MATQFAYYPGCIAEFSSKELDKTKLGESKPVRRRGLPITGARSSKVCCDGARDARWFIPRARGTRQSGLIAPIPKRSIPARAGNTS